MNCICCLSNKITQEPAGLSKYFFCQTCGFLFQKGKITDYKQKSIVDHFQNSDPHHTVANSKKDLFDLFINYLSTKIVKKNRRILDIGCGYGYFLNQAKKKGWETSGVEIAAKVASAAQKKIGKNKIFFGQLKQAKYFSESFDAVTLWDVLFVVENPADELKECYRILKPGGIIGLRVRNVLFQKFAYVAYKPFRKIGAKFKLKNPSVFHLCCFSSSSIESLLIRLGFTNIQILNSPLTTGDPYDHAKLKSIVRIFKHGIFFFSKLIYTLSCKKWVIGPSLLVWAEKVE